MVRCIPIILFLLLTHLWSINIERHANGSCSKIFYLQFVIGGLLNVQFKFASPALYFLKGIANLFISAVFLSNSRPLADIICQPVLGSGLNVSGCQIALGLSAAGKKADQEM